MTRKEINDLLDLNKEFFDLIEGLDGQRQTDKAYGLISEVEPLPQWIRTAPSDARPGEIYEYIPIGILEALCDRVFSYRWNCEIINHLQVQDKDTGRWVVSIDVKIYYRLTCETEWRFVSGSASSTCETVTQLSFTGPSTLSEAKKSAIRQIGTLFGRDLNRGTNESEGRLEVKAVIDTKAEEEIDRELAALTEKVKNCEFAEDAIDLIRKSTFKHNKSLEKIALVKPSTIVNTYPKTL